MLAHFAPHLQGEKFAMKRKRFWKRELSEPKMHSLSLIEQMSGTRDKTLNLHFTLQLTLLLFLHCRDNEYLVLH